MYGMYGGCTTLFHLAVRYPILVLALTLTGFVHEVRAPGPGDRMGTVGVLSQLQQEIVKQHPDLPGRAHDLEGAFAVFEPALSEDAASYILSNTDACTDVSAEDILSDTDRRREAAWLFFLDTYSREGPMKAEQLFRSNSSPPVRKD
jgi:hypothetical protein